MRKILIVDDELEMRQLLRIYLLQESYQIDEAENGQEAFEKVKNNSYDLILLDVMMPVMDGWQTIEQIRKISNTPIILLTAKGSTKDKVTGLAAGADDYIVKPFDEEELLARVQALLRRANTPAMNEKALKYKGIVLDHSSREALYLGKRLNLTQTEFDLLATFIENKGIVLSREQLVSIIWGVDFMGEDRTVDSHIRNLREKLKTSGMEERMIKTVWGIGYKLE
ncbi:DNA-binding response regulator [Neobacillus notoginsengisoli]|uniref:DNA-binding response regulator n=1 Tax=Neobacillus notoginsengisoli TaxID=1578198 RepID=A0A417YRL6_9BACI|nr:response regulator transcription factor [Neobacillus notoginsengisoli]RHW37387.1 DNA-binding response regulator [Neobacillus notoginsengisoli]